MGANQHSCKRINLTLVCADRTGQVVVEANDTWLRSNFDNRQIAKLVNGRAVRKGMYQDRRLYWVSQPKKRKRLQAQVAP